MSRQLGKTGLPSAIGTNWSQKPVTPVSQAYWFFIHFLSTAPAAVETRVTTGATEEEKVQLVEAILFVAKESLSSRKLAQVAGLADATEARTLVRLLNHRYDSGGRVFRIEEVAGGFCLLTRPQFAPWLRRLRYIPGELRLTQSAMETLAIVAYRQPVPRADIESIRGVSCGELLKQLMQRELVRICGRSEELGRPYLYGTTRLFLQMFGLRNADRLPRSQAINGPTGIAPSVNENLSESSIEHDSGTGKDAKESTVKQSFSAATLLHDSVEQADDILLNAHLLRAVDDDDEDEEYFDDDDDEDDDEEFEDEEFEDEDDDEEFEDDEEGDAEVDDEEEGFDDEDDDWEEVDDEDADAEEEDEWDDDEDDDDWDEDDDEEAEEGDDDEEWD